MTPGRGGVGKSTFHAWLAANITIGTLPGIHFGTPAAVIIAAAEDSWERTIVGRLLVAGADMTRVYRADVVVDEGSISETSLTLPADCAALEAEIQRVGAVMLSVDPLISSVDGGLDTHKDREVRAALQPLAQLADRTGCAVLGNAHFGKANGHDPLALMMGSVAFGNVARAVLGFASDTDTDDRGCVISQVKNNLGRLDLPSLRYMIEEATLPTAEGPASVGRLVMLGESDRSVSDILRDAHGDTEEGDELVEMLRLILDDAHGEIAAADGMKRLRGFGAAPSKGTLHRARKRAGIDSQKAAFGGGWVWRDTAEGSTQGSEGSTLQRRGTFGTFVEPSGPVYGCPTHPGTPTNSRNGQCPECIIAAMNSATEETA